MERDHVCLVLLSVWVFLGHHFKTPSVLPLVPAGVMSARQALTGFEHLQWDIVQPCALDMEEGVGGLLPDKLPSLLCQLFSSHFGR